MAQQITLHPFENALFIAKKARGKKHVLFGNGFSIGAHPKFKYGTLYEQAISSGLPSHIEALFTRYGTTNFELVLRTLEEGQWLANHYSLIKSTPGLDMVEDYETVKEALVDSIAANHPELPAELPDGTLDCGLTFLRQFDDVFTTNYDLLPYWASLSGCDFPFEDGFGRESDTDETYCVFLPTGSNNKHIYFLHGALHFYAEEGEVRKMVWNTTGVPLMDQVREALDNRRYPLIVSEGDSTRKLERIESSSYLSNCARRFENIQGNLFVYGSSLSEQDNHILEWISKNTTLPRIFIGVHGDHTSGNGAELVERGLELVEERKAVLKSGNTGRRLKKESLEVFFYQSETANVWPEHS